MRRFLSADYVPARGVAFSLWFWVVTLSLLVHMTIDFFGQMSRHDFCYWADIALAPLPYAASCVVLLCALADGQRTRWVVFRTFGPSLPWLWTVRACFVLLIPALSVVCVVAVARAIG
jgi:hypothetical protein